MMQMEMVEMLPKIAIDRPIFSNSHSAQNTIMTAIQAADAKALIIWLYDLPDLMKRVGKALRKGFN